MLLEIWNICFMNLNIYKMYACVRLLRYSQSRDDRKWDLYLHMRVHMCVCIYIHTRLSNTWNSYMTTRHDSICYPWHSHTKMCTLRLDSLWRSCCKPLNGIVLPDFPFAASASHTKDSSLFRLFFSASLSFRLLLRVRYWSTAHHWHMRKRFGAAQHWSLLVQVRHRAYLGQKSCFQWVSSLMMRSIPLSEGMLVRGISITKTDVLLLCVTMVT